MGMAFGSSGAAIRTSDFHVWRWTGSIEMTGRPMLEIVPSTPPCPPVVA
jgi:hypothetical protein